MASLSSVSSSNSLGNTSLRGFGGMASGIDRDAIIEQMTLGTNTKIENQKSNMTKLQWKQEAYRGITDQILDLTDKYASYSSTSNLKDSSIFSKSLITVHGAESATRFVTATGTSSLVDNVAITAVKRLATATVRQSNKHIVDKVRTKALDLMNDDAVKYSKLEGTKLQIGSYDKDYKFTEAFTFKFESSYTTTTADGKSETKTIGYVPKDGETEEAFAERLANELNEMIAATDSYKGNISFKAENGKLLLAGDLTKESNVAGGSKQTGLVINTNSSALGVLGYTHSGASKGADWKAFNDGISSKVMETSVGERSVLDTLAGQKLIFEYDGSQKSVELISQSELAELKGITNDGDRFQKVVDNLQARLDKAFGKGAITVGKEEVSGEGFKLTFDTKGDSSVALLSNDDNLLKTLGVEFGESNKVNVDGKLGQAALGLDANAYTNANGQLDLKINGVSITGLTANSTISDILSKINSTTVAGVKATYVDATGQFMLVSSETGEGREVSLDSVLADKLFGGYSYKVSDSVSELKDAAGNVYAKKNDEGKFIIESGYDSAGEEVDFDKQLFDKDGKLLAEKNSEGKFILMSGQFAGKEIDENGNIKGVKKNVEYYIAADGKTWVNEAGYKIDPQGRLRDDEGFFTDKNGNLVNKEGKLVAIVKDDGTLAEKGVDYTIDGDGDFVSITDGKKLESNSGSYQVKRINADGHFVVDGADGKERLSDINGNLVDKDGYFVNENNVRVIKNANGTIDKYVSRDGYEVDEKGNYISEDGKLVGRFTDGWYRVAEDGNVLGQYYIRKDGDAWYRTDKDGKYIDKDGNEVTGDKREKIEVPEGFQGDAGKDVTEVHVKNVAGTWYRTNEKGEYIDKGGNAVTEDKREAVGVPNGFNPTRMDPAEKLYTVNDDGSITVGRIDPVNVGKTVDKDGYELDKDGNRLGDTPLIKTGHNSAQVSVGGTVKTNGPQYEGLYKMGGFTENIDEGQNAKIQVSYGNGVTVDIERSSNTFNLEGLSVSVSGTFGGEYKKDADGNATDEWISDSSQTVTFSAKADVDKALETVKAFFEDFNALVTEINGQVTARPDSDYGPLTSAQKEEMDETSIENWEKKAKQGILFGDDVMRDLSGSMEGILAKLMSYGVNYQDLEKIGISYSEDYLDGGTLVFDESKFRSTMESDPDLVSKLISGGENGGKGLIHVVEDAVTPYATRYASKNGNSYGRLIEVAGTEKKPTTLMSNQIYKQLKEMQETIDKLQSQLKIEQDRYISQFTTMESLLNQMNTQSSYLSQLTA